MENCIEKMDKLIAVKKTKGHKINKRESEEYSQAWMELINAKGNFSAEAEKYFYAGFIFTGAKPFVKWVLGTENPFASLDTMLKGNLFGKETNITFRVLVSVLANLLISDLPNVNLICPVIKAIPVRGKNKEKKILGVAHKILLKYYIDEIDLSIHYPVLKDLKVNPGVVHEFVALMDELLERLKTTALSNKQALVVNGISSWLHPKDVIMSKNSGDEPQNKDSGNTTTNSSEAPAKVEPKKASYDELANILKQACLLTEQLGERAAAADISKKEAVNKAKELVNKIDLLTKQEKESQQKILNLNTQLSEKNVQISLLNNKIHDLEQDIVSLKKELSAKKTEISERTQMIEALSRDRAKQSEEAIKRLSSKLKVEYRDFMDAQDQLMSEDLGENMREQLKSVFGILEKAGVTLN